jgi:hypothetical protein
MTRPNFNRHLEPRYLRALAYTDAVRDILRADGVFKLSDDGRDAVWEWDGVIWRHFALPSRNMFQLPPAEDEGVASAR